MHVSMTRIEDEVISMAEADFIDSTCEDKKTFEINEIGYKVQVLMAQIKVWSGFTTKKNFVVQSVVDLIFL